MPPYKKQQTYINIVPDDPINEHTINNSVKSLDSFFGIGTGTGTDTDTDTGSNSVIKTVTQPHIVYADDGKVDIANIKKVTEKPVNNIVLSHIEIRNKIEKLNEDEMSEVFRIIKHGTEKYTVNKNGIFINLNSLKYVTIKELSTFLLFCENNSKLINDDEKTRAIYKQLVT